MNMLRGALAFLLLTLPIALFQCMRPDDNAKPDASSSPVTSAEERTRTVECVPKALLCPGDPCVVTVSVNDTSPGAAVSTAQDPIYLAPTQSIEWSAVLGSGGSGNAKLHDLQVVNVGNSHKRRVGTNNPKQQPRCKNDKCSADAVANFEPCKVYTYYAVVHHTHGSQTDTKETDPEIEVAGTTTVRLDTTGTSTSGTSGTH